MSYIECQDKNRNVLKRIQAPFDESVNCHLIIVSGTDFTKMKVKGKCFKIWFPDIDNFNDVDLNGFIDLEIDNVIVGEHDNGLLKLLELNCKKIEQYDMNIEHIINKYLSEEPDPLMRDVQGCKYELAVNGYGDRL